MNAQPQPQPNPYVNLAGKRLAVGIPSGRSVEAHFSMSLAGMLSFTGLHGVKCGAFSEIRAMISASRNSIVERARQLEPDFLLMIDSDMMFPPTAALQLMSHDLDIVCATYNRRVPPYQVLGKLMGPAKGENIQGGLREAKFMPGGMMLIKFSVFEKLSFPYFFETYDWDGETPSSSFIRMLADWSYSDLPLDIRSLIAGSPEFTAWLEANKAQAVKEVDTQWKMTGEDYNFCRKVRKAGFKIFCDFDLTFNIAHIGEQIITMERAPLGPPPDPASISDLSTELVDAGAP